MGQLISVGNFVKHQRILVLFSLLDLHMNDSCADMTHLTGFMLLHYLVKLEMPNIHMNTNVALDDNCETANKCIRIR